MNIERRIEKAEKAVGLDAGPMLVPVLIIDVDDAKDGQPPFPKPVTDWVTAQRAVNEGGSGVGCPAYLWRTRLPNRRPGTRSDSGTANSREADHARIEPTHPAA
jgi:hypothetical protein